MSCDKSGHDYLGRLIQIIAHKLRYQADDNLVRNNITFEQVRVLRYLKENSENGQLFQKEIEEAFSIKRSSVTSILNNMEKAGLVTRIQDPDDARAKKLLMTPKGWEMDQQLGAFIHNTEMQLIKGMTESEVALLKLLLRKALDNIDK